VDAGAVQVTQKKSVILRKFKKISSKMPAERGESRGAQQQQAPHGKSEYTGIDSNSNEVECA